MSIVHPLVQSTTVDLFKRFYAGCSVDQGKVVQFSSGAVDMSATAVTDGRTSFNIDLGSLTDLTDITHALAPKAAVPRVPRKKRKCALDDRAGADDADD
eukprot:2270423-Pyramimonas_sp.AAC.1